MVSSCRLGEGHIGVKLSLDRRNYLHCTYLKGCCLSDCICLIPLSFQTVWPATLNGLLIDYYSSYLYNSCFNLSSYLYSSCSSVSSLHAVCPPSTKQQSACPSSAICFSIFITLQSVSSLCSTQASPQPSSRTP